MLVELKHAWNPDYVGGYRALVRRPKKPQVMAVPTLAAASKACLDYIAHYQLGGGNWAGGLVTDNDGNVIATVSYNGRREAGLRSR